MNKRHHDDGSLGVSLQWMVGGEIPGGGATAAGYLTPKYLLSLFLFAVDAQTIAQNITACLPSCCRAKCMQAVYIPALLCTLSYFYLVG